MIRIVSSKSRTPEDYKAMASILMHGLSAVCHNNKCNSCEAKRICRSVIAAMDYAVKQADKPNT